MRGSLEGRPDIAQRGAIMESSLQLGLLRRIGIYIYTVKICFKFNFRDRYSQCGKVIGQICMCSQGKVSDHFSVLAVLYCDDSRRRKKSQNPSI